MSTPETARSKAERSEATRQVLVAAARALFAERGFADATTTEIVERAGVTRGALYHHFRDKEDLFRAVYEDVEQDLVARAAGALGESTDPLDQLKVASGAFLDACTEPDVQRIVLLEGPSVLGWNTWRELDEAYGLGMTKAALQAAMDVGAMPPGPVDVLAHVLLAALIEAGMVLAHATDPEATRAEVEQVLGAMIDGLARG